MNFQMSRLDLLKAEEPEITLPPSIASSKKQESCRKTSISALLTMPKLLTVWITINCGKFWRRWEYQSTWPSSWETDMQVRKQQNWTRNNKLVANFKAVYCPHAYLTYIQSTSWETWAGGSTSWNKDCWEKYQEPQICRWHHLYGRKWRRTKEPLGEIERREWKTWLKT